MPEYPRIPLGDIAPKADAPMPDADALVWNLSLKDVEACSGAVGARRWSLVRDLGSTKCSFDSRHVLYSKLRPYLNKVVVPDQPGVGTSEFLPLLPDLKRMDRSFLAYYLRSSEFVQFAVAHSRGANLPRVEMRALWTHLVPAPSLEEQRRIVEQIEYAFGRLNDVRKLRNEIRSEATSIFPALLADCFGGPTNGYPIRTVEQVSVETRYGTSRRCSRYQHGLPVLRIPNVTNGTISFANVKWCDQMSEQEISLLSLQDGDLLVVRTNGSRDLIARCAVFRQQERPYAFASYLIRIRLERKCVDPQFLAFFLDSTMGRSAIRERVRTSAGQYNINAKNLRSIPFPCPPLGIQKSVVDQMSRRKRVVDSILTAHSDLERQDLAARQAVLHRAFTGKS